MLLMGDEVRRTQQGNNNAYCQDNEISWFDWRLCTVNAEIVRFVQHMIRIRLDFDHGIEGGRITLEEYLSKAHIEWHGIELGKPDWSNDSHSLAFTLHSFVSRQVRYIAINAYWKSLEFELPPVAGGPHAGWIRLIDTSCHPRTTYWKRRRECLWMTPKYLVNPRSIVMLHYDYATQDQT